MSRERDTFVPNDDDASTRHAIVWLALHSEGHRVGRLHTFSAAKRRHGAGVTVPLPQRQMTPHDFESVPCNVWRQLCLKEIKGNPKV